MECFDENRLLELASGSVPLEELHAAELHLDECADCRYLLAEIVQPDRLRIAALDLQPGIRVGRYIIVSRLGAGGMGTVYVAYDPVLQRRIALKLLRQRDSDPVKLQAHSARLRQEAQSMARLHHPSVLEVHDVGSAGGHVYIAMELIDGRTVRSWLAEQPRSWPEILHIFVLAGEGLQAAHRAGIVHRDFKPDNVLCARDGRVLVADFGLAALAIEQRADSRAEPAARPLSEPPLRGMPMSTERPGTPYYVAPEQALTGEVTARADQFSFCVSLYEALCGKRPFGGRTLGELMAEIAAGPPLSDPMLAALPRSIRNTLQRGLSADSAARFPAMTELLAGLRQRPRQYGHAALLLGAALALVIIGWGLFYRVSQPRKHCLAQANEASQHDERTAALIAQLGSAGDRGHLVMSLLIRQKLWRNVAQASCRERPLPPPEAAATAQLTAACLRQRRVELQTVVEGLLANASGLRQDAQQIELALLQLPGPESCLPTPIRQTQGPSAYRCAARSACVQAQEQLARLRGQIFLKPHRGESDFDPSISTAELETAQKSEEPVLHIDALLLKSRLGLGTDSSIRLLREALFIAMAEHEEDRAARAWVALVEALPQEQARRYLGHARAALARIGGDARLAAALDAIATTKQLHE